MYQAINWTNDGSVSAELQKNLKLHILKWYEGGNKQSHAFDTSWDLRSTACGLEEIKALIILEK